MRWALAIALVGCGAPPPPTRADAIAEALIDRDRALIDERPDLVAGKLARMASAPQEFLAGSAALFYRDAALDALDGDGHDFGQILGDLHAESVGATFDDAGMLIDCLDFDASTPAPLAWEVRRAGLGVATAAVLAGRDLDGAAAAAGEMAAGYLDALDGGAAPLREGDPALGAILGDLLADARARRDARAELASSTAIGPSGRRLLRDETLTDPPPPFDRGLDGALAAYRATRKAGPVADGWLRVKDAARRLGDGVASFADLRLWVLVEGDTASDGDDVLLELLEERDPPLAAAAVDNGERVALAGARLDATAGVDPDLGFVDWQGVSFRVRRVTAGRRALDLDETADALLDRVYGETDLRALARAVGRVMGAAHARSADPSTILAAIADRDAFRRAVEAAAARDVERLFDDYGLFVAALHARGPLLGAR